MLNSGSNTTLICPILAAVPHLSFEKHKVPFIFPFFIYRFSNRKIPVDCYYLELRPNKVLPQYFLDAFSGFSGGEVEYLLGNQYKLYDVPHQL